MKELLPYDNDELALNIEQFTLPLLAGWPMRYLKAAVNAYRELGIDKNPGEEGGPVEEFTSNNHHIEFVDQRMTILDGENNVVSDANRTAIESLSPSVITNVMNRLPQTRNTQLFAELLRQIGKVDGDGGWNFDWYVIFKIDGNLEACGFKYTPWPCFTCENERFYFHKNADVPGEILLVMPE